MTFEEQVERESLRLYARYAREIVEGLSFCPYAAGSREAGRVRVRSLPQAVRPEVVAALVLELADDAEVDIGIVVLPLLDLDRQAFARFVSAVRELVPSRGASSFALADFHPDKVDSLESPGDLTSFIRRTPDPTIQLVRMRALEQVRSREGHGSGFVDVTQLAALEALRAPTAPPLHERIAELNRATIAREGLVSVEARLEDIHRDRRETYARLRGAAEA